MSNVTELKKDAMEFEAIDGVPVEKPEETPEEVKTEKKRGVFRTIGHYVAAPFRFVGRKLKENPGSAAVGATLGGGLVLGGKALIDFIKDRRSSGEEDAVEIEDTGEIVRDEAYETDDNIDEAM